MDSGHAGFTDSGYHGTFPDQRPQDNHLVFTTFGRYLYQDLSVTKMDDVLIPSVGHPRGRHVHSKGHLKGFC